MFESFEYLEFSYACRIEKNDVREKSVLKIVDHPI